MSWASDWYPAFCMNLDCGKHYQSRTIPTLCHIDGLHIRISRQTQSGYKLQVTAGMHCSQGFERERYKLLGKPKGPKKKGEDSPDIIFQIQHGHGRISSPYVVENIFIPFDRKACAFVNKFFENFNEALTIKALIPELIRIINEYRGDPVMCLLELIHGPLFERRYKRMQNPAINQWPEPPLTVIKSALS